MQADDATLQRLRAALDDELHVDWFTRPDDEGLNRILTATFLDAGPLHLEDDDVVVLRMPPAMPRRLIDEMSQGFFPGRRVIAISNDLDLTTARDVLEQALEYDADEETDHGQ